MDNKLKEKQLLLKIRLLPARPQQMDNSLGYDNVFMYHTNCPDLRRSTQYPILLAIDRLLIRDIRFHPVIYPAQVSKKT